MSDFKDVVVLGRKPPMRKTIVACLPIKKSGPKPTGHVGYMYHGTIYFLYCDEANAVKIGITQSDVRNRMCVLQSGCPYDLRLIALMSGTFHTEGMLHTRFRHLWMRGEWFRYEADLAEYIEGLCDE